MLKNAMLLHEINIKPYIDAETGMVMAADGGRDNLILNTATLIALLGDGSGWEMKALRFLSSVTVAPGLYKRYPGHTGSNSVDNLIGAACASYLIPSQIRLWARHSRWCFNVEKPGSWAFRHWYWKFIGIPPFIHMAAGRPIGLFYQLTFALACIFSTFSERGNTSDKCLQFLINRRVEHRYPLVNWSIRIWRNRMAKKYPGGMAEVYSIYFGPEHPFTRYARKDFN